MSDFTEVISINTELFQKTFPLPIKLEMSGIIFWLHLIPLLNSPALFEVSSIIRRSRSQQFWPRLAVSYENATQSTVHAQAAAQSTKVLVLIKYHFKQKLLLNWLQDRHIKFTVLNSRTEIPGIGPGTTESPLFFINRVFSQISTLSFGSFFFVFFLYFVKIVITLTPRCSIRA